MSKKVASKAGTSKNTTNVINDANDDAPNTNVHDDDVKINLCEKIGIDIDEIDYDSLTPEKCKAQFDKLQNAYMKLTNYLVDLDKVRQQCVIKLTKVQHKYKSLSAKEDMPIQQDIQAEMQKHEDNKNDSHELENTDANTGTGAGNADDVETIKQTEAPKKVIKKVVKAATATSAVVPTSESSAPVESKEVKKTIVKARVKKADDVEAAPATPAEVVTPAATATAAATEGAKTVVKKKK